MRWQKEPDQISEPRLKRIVERIDVQAEQVAHYTVPVGGRLTYDDAWTLPVGWLRCDGTTYNVVDYRGLYGIIKNTFGGTAGSTFKVPTAADTIIKT